MTSERKKSILKTAAAAGILLIFGAGVYYIGFTTGHARANTVVVEGARNADPTNSDANFGLFWEAWQKLKDEHIKGQTVTNQNLVYGAIEGLTNALGDPNTNFFRPDDSKKFEEDVGGNFGGIGAEIGIKNEQIVVVAPLPESPAEKAGIKAGDKIIQINDESTFGFDVNTAVKKIRGEIGTKVKLTVVGADNDKTKEVTITRETITVPTLKTDVLDGNISHIQLYSFNQNAPFMFYRAALGALLGGSKGIILDLRNDPGGFLEVAINIAGWFVDKGTIVARERFKDGREITYPADGTGALKNIPIVVLMNKGSASASEILAGALRDNNKVKLIGETSFGKGTVQELFPLSDGSKLKITIANWLTPNHTLIDHDGLKPDVAVALTEDDAKAQKDPQLAKALEVLKQEISNR